jgi:hypothetical protein
VLITGGLENTLPLPFPLLELLLDLPLVSSHSPPFADFALLELFEPLLLPLPDLPPLFSLFLLDPFPLGRHSTAGSLVGCRSDGGTTGFAAGLSTGVGMRTMGAGVSFALCVIGAGASFELWGIGAGDRVGAAVPAIGQNSNKGCVTDDYQPQDCVEYTNCKCQVSRRKSLQTLH